MGADLDGWGPPLAQHCLPRRAAVQKARGQPLQLCAAASPGARHSIPSVPAASPLALDRRRAGPARAIKASCLP